MPVSPTYPGVYVQEVPSGVRAIAGVPTSVALFIGRAKQGPIGVPLEFFNYTDFVRAYSDDSSLGDMARQVRLFFMNGGSDCYVMRIANGATFATVILQAENGNDVLQLTSKQAGAIGESIRASVTSSVMQPESTFDIELFLWVTERGTKVRRDVESWKNLSMDPASPLYAPTFLSQNSNLVDAAPGAGVAAATKGFSQSGRPVPYTNATPTTFRTAWAALIGTGGLANAQAFQISVDGSAYVTVNLSALNAGAITGVTSVNTIKTNVADAIKGVIDQRFIDEGLSQRVAVSFEEGPTATGTAADRTSLLKISTAAASGDVWIRPAAADDATVPLMLGTEQGGLEVSSFARNRPAPNGITFKAASLSDYQTFAALRQDAITLIRLEAVDATGAPTTVNVPVDLVTTNPNGSDPMWKNADAVTDDSSGVREKLGLIRDAINDFAGANPETFAWSADLAGNRLSISPTRQTLDNFVSAAFRTEPTGNNQAGRFLNNTRFYSVGNNGTATAMFPNADAFQVPAAQAASDGGPPTQADYQAAYEIADKIDLFNLLILPADAQPAQPTEQLYGPASVFCQRRRAFLLMDPPGSWTGFMAAKNGIAALRVGLVKDHSAVFFPRLTVNEGGLDVPLGPSGAIAGLISRTDATQGVWTAPAGVDADLRGIVGLQRRLSDPENGAINPQGINALRIFPAGIVNWGARTMDGADDFASEYKYIPVRRVALFIEESLYRGLKWVVFDPNGEPLWAQIRMNVGAFMQTLFRKGAFAGTTPQTSYFVKCDRETTTPADENLGIVNIWVGFAPLKPAEFVILYLQQMTAQAEA